MSVLSKYNKGPKFVFRFEDEANYEYKKLSELDPKEKYIIYTMYINDKGEYDDHPVFASAALSDTHNNIFLVDIPTHLTETVKEMINDDEIVALANAGSLGFKTRSYEYEKKEKGKMVKKVGYSVDFIDFSEE